MNLNKLAREITLKEKGKEISIAQVKEVMKILFTILAHVRPVEVFKILEKYEN